MFKHSFILMLLLANTFCLASAEKFNDWVGKFKSEASSTHGFDKEFLNRVFEGVKFNPRVVDHDRGQAEFVRSMGSYINLMISRTRIAKGQAKVRELSDLFVDIKNDYDVQGNYLVSFWAMETNFSMYTGKMDLIQSLATLAFEGRRGRFFKNELIEALKILNNEKFIFPTERIQGSWAGAMGSTQFIPSNINLYAHDYDRDGYIDMWNSKADFLASSAKFLKAVGWDGQKKWAYEVELPSDFDYLNSGLHIKKNVSLWRELGVSRVDGLELEDSSKKVSLYLPQGHKGPALLVYPNFRTIFRWNNSAKYALAVGILADFFGQDSRSNGASYMDKFDLEEESFLTFDLTKALQSKLNELGFNAGGVDGMIGPKTYSAVQRYQHSQGIIADGHLTKDLMLKILK